jgi:hypothetical protein
MRGYASNRQSGFQIRYYRDQEWADAWERAGIYKPAGYVTSKADPVGEENAKAVARHINSFNPTYPCLVVKVS